MSISNQDALVTVEKDRGADFDIDRLDLVEAADHKKTHQEMAITKHA
jgi:hypothetical protein